MPKAKKKPKKLKKHKVRKKAAKKNPRKAARRPKPQAVVEPVVELEPISVEVVRRKNGDVEVIEEFAKPPDWRERRRQRVLARLAKLFPEHFGAPALHPPKV